MTAGPSENTDADAVRWHSAERLSEILCAAPLIVFAIDIDGIIRVSTGGALIELGFAPGQLVGNSIFDVYAERADFAGHFRRAIAGEEFDIQATVLDRVFETRYTPTYSASGELIGSLGVSVDVTEQVKNQNALRQLAQDDSVTGLSSRQYTESLIGRALAAGAGFAVLLVDLDDFKDINDSHGHALGDLVLNRIATRIRTAVPEEAIVGRLGGDELVIGLPLSDFAALERVAKDVLAVIAGPLLIDLPILDPPADIDVSITASIGVAVSPRDGNTTAGLLARADTAMYAAKNSGGAAYRFYSPDIDRASRRLTVSTRLRRAVAEHALHAEFQPVLDIECGRVVAFEALARWNDPQLGKIRPDEFIALAEKSPLIDELFEVILQQALAAAAGWDSSIGISVNIAPRQLRDRDLPNRIVLAAKGAGLEVDRVSVELTETAMMDDSFATRNTLQKMSEAGIAVVVDDFGVGYSNIGRLSDLSASGMLDGIKIDRRFVAERDIHRATSLLRLFRNMTDSFGVRAVVEGIETERQLTLARDLGYRYAQGWHLGAAMPAAAATTYANSTTTGA
ncbi:bifunctional diguanylate cyclase/phosphodiesterase [Antrihabitans sp. YC2-6]|uniref:putative bifunctional diguanylate cyclase/phosphodiesterase n=1 Tax=Antrihabitans sp. YC2-6 TaxID=2799498 RepID=UPI0018F7B155|nr:EAL domain-containing protein [Antrihabitans sp. YC2-6]MBJ8348573.1 EAL domain-containing protein [Antrihabitans sp. YC2-6]